ncbi:embryo-specific protein ATS3B-like isoform X2 [Lycium barbarum]|uniref:embryo-specific protein ATS3B-like isoform X2 n=1 Tax=Lycium barbarum TaxID=112863 RepID=UPI00293E5E67|nr:embryo-specific protein ATS3B-like isoform X2 [Lycium barbarum]
MSPTMIRRPAILVLLFITVASITTGAQASRSIVFHPQPISSLDIINTTLNQNAPCSFTVSIKTSCYSPTQTRDQISLAFGDAYGNQVYAPRLDDPVSRAFERCSTDTYTVYGSCTYQICYVYLYRSGYDGWIPTDVTIYGYNSKAVTFIYNVNIPRDTWYGHNYCRSRAVKSVGNLGWTLLSIGSTLLYTIAGLFRG